jgi:hypothetical protein
MKKIILFYVLLLVLIFFISWFAVNKIYEFGKSFEEKKADKELKNKKETQDRIVKDLLTSRRSETEKVDDADLFGEDGIAKILLIGLDSRAGQTNGHCDAIQLIGIDRNKQTVSITAVPRGTYSPLPPGVGATSSDYYISNACGLVGLDYGIEQIEKILGEKEDYLVVVGFSEVLGILRNLKLPTTDTLRWLRHRQGYAIGEPQRAHNHSTFLKQLILRFLPEKESPADKLWEYFIYKMVKTDLSFAQARSLAKVLAQMSLKENPERILLFMRPAYNVQDIPYSEEYLSEYLEKMLNPVKDLLDSADYSGEEEQEIQKELLRIIGEKISDPDFFSWAFDNNLWLQIEDKEKRLAIQYDFLERYFSTVNTFSEKENIIADYILEMENIGENFWAEKGKNLLKTLVP